ncbi:MAG: helix-turn-helix domain-containing protein [Bacilli bacterium]|nr:helix-turn-helix domain-containing protein [Bacilli bacterium]
MNQEKIGKFIAECRKDKKMTQSELAERLGVTDKSIGNWENGRNMPDLSLFKPICDELGITINELLSGERLKKEKYQEKLEENIINTIDYSTSRINIIRNNLGILLVIIGVLLSFTAMTMFASESSWGSIYSVLGGIISMIGISKLTRNYIYSKRLVICIIYFILFFIALFVIDYISVISLKQIPRFCTIKAYFDNGIVCENPIYNVYRINIDTSNEYIIVDRKKEYTIDTVPNVPFNRSKSGIDNIIKYKNKYVGNNSNDGNLISSLPLSEYGYVFEIDSDNLGLIIDYHITDWYINENYYLEKSIVYNSVSIFSLIDNVKYIKYNFSGKTYEVKRENVENSFPNYENIIHDGINKDAFNKYLEEKISDTDFINMCFNKFVS